MANYNEYVVELKWGKDDKYFHCKHCGNENCCDGKNEFSKECTRCKREEGLYVGTAFQHSKLSLDSIIKILEYYQEILKEFHDYAIGEGINKLINNTLTNTRDNYSRPSFAEIAEALSIQKKTVELLVNKIIDWLPESFTETQPNYEQWLDKLPTYDKIRFTAFYNLLFNGDVEPDDDVYYRTPKEMLYILVKREYMPDDDNRY